QINSSCIYQYVWSWTINNDFSLDFSYLIDPLTSIMSILITTIGIMVLIYSDNYMAHDQGYLRFFAYMSFFSTSMFLNLCFGKTGLPIFIIFGTSTCRNRRKIDTDSASIESEDNDNNRVLSHTRKTFLKGDILPSISVSKDLVNSVDQFLRKDLQNARERLSDEFSFDLLSLV
ncbi:NADH dehydrogenase subunit 5 (chloroplast), partial [Olea europaea subsp. europaea]